MQAVIEQTRYNPPISLRNAHWHTIYASKLRKIDGPQGQRQRWDTPDGDFIDVDVVNNESDTTIILGHGLEGDSTRPYITGMINVAQKNGWNAVAWNCRSCSGEINLKPRLYYHGDIEDIDFVIKQSIEKLNSKKILLYGISMGGCIILNYLGSTLKKPKEIVGAAAISAPLNIPHSAKLIQKGFNKIYTRHFLKQLKAKVKLKAQQFPGWLNLNPIDKIKRWEDFDRLYSVPLTNSKSMKEFYHKCSAINRIQNIEVPTLLLNAYDDPMLDESSYPKSKTLNPNLLGFYPPKGAHTAFILSNSSNNFAEKVANYYLTSVLEQNIDDFVKHVRNFN